MQNIDLFRLDGHALRVLVSVCETGSVSRTAEVFGVNQSTISHIIEKLRAAVGDPLFVKSGRGITPTEKALTILPRVQQILSDIEGLVQLEKFDVARDARPVVIGLPSPTFSLDIKVLHASLLRAEPKLKLELRRLAPRDQLKNMLSDGAAEIAITVAGNHYPSTLNHCEYGHDQLAIFYDPACRDPITTVEEYAQARHGTVNFGGSPKSEVQKALALMDIKRDVALVAPTASMLGDLIEGTDIIATMPESLKHSAYAKLACTPPPFELPGLVYDLAWHRRYEASGRHQWLRKMLLEARREVEQTIAAQTPK